MENGSAVFYNGKYTLFETVDKKHNDKKITCNRKKKKKTKRDLYFPRRKLSDIFKFYYCGMDYDRNSKRARLRHTSNNSNNPQLISFHETTFVHWTLFF